VRRAAIVVPGLEQSGGHPHAILVDDTPYVGGRASTYRGDRETGLLFGEHVDRVFRDTQAILRTAGLSYEHAMKCNFYVGRTGAGYGQFDENYVAMRTVRGRYLPDTRWAGTGVEMDLTSRESRFELEVVAGFTQETVLTPHVWTAPGPPRFPQTTRSAHAARVGLVHYVQGQVAWDLQGNPVGAGDIDVQARHSFGLLDHIVRGLDVTWDCVVKITTFLRHPEHYGRLAEVQDGYLAPGRCAATTVLAAPADGLLEEPELIVATSCEKAVVVAPDVHRYRGHAHAVRAGRTIFTSAQVPLDARGNLPEEGRFEGQAVQVFRNLGRVLEGAGASWSDVIKLNAYLKDRRDHAALVRIRNDHVPATSVVVTDLISGAVDPRFLLQADCVAAVA
jgi:enamine deaminase RidA (YjgF/YER057c/UK114 family)